MFRTEQNRGSLRAATTLVVTVIAILVVIEAVHPYFFFQDDNRGLNLPCYLHNVRSLLGGESPLFNFHQFLGTPHLALLQPASFYPLTYLAVLGSQAALGHPFAAIDILAFAHIVLAAAGSFALFRFFGLRPAAASFGALAWAFNGFVVVASDSWIHISGAAAALPWTLLLTLRLRRKPDAEGMLLLAVVRTLFFLQGYPQTFVYGAILEVGVVAATILPSNSTEPGAESGPSGRFLALYGLHILLVAALAAPVLLPAVEQIAASASRAASMPLDKFREASLPLTDWLFGLVAPRGDVFGGLGTWFQGRTLSHIGYLTVAFALFSAVGLGSLPLGRRRVIAAFSALGIFWILFACDLGVTRIFWNIPILDRFRWPFKGLLFANFAFIVVAAHGFDAFQERIERWGGNGKKCIALMVPALLTAHIANFLALHTASPQLMFGRQYDRPPLVEPMREILSEGRIATVGFKETVTEGFAAPALGDNFATLFGLHHFEGREVLLAKANSEATFELAAGTAFCFRESGLSLDPERKALPFAHLRRWGVRWYVVPNDLRLTDVGEEIRPVFHDGRRTILRDERAFPMVFWDDPPSVDGLVHVMKGNTVRVGVTDGPGGVLVVNVLHHPNFKATVDGRPVPLRESAVGQIEVFVPPGKHDVRVSYADPLFDLGLAIAGVALLVVAGCFVAGRRRKAAHPAQTVTVS